jgi:hypothetical protein
MKATLYTTLAAPCWKCRGTVAKYETDSAVSLIGVRCLICGSPDLFCAPVPPQSEADCATMHREESR